MSRAELAECCGPLYTQMQAFVSETLATAGIEAAALDAVELLGGGTRMPSVQVMADCGPDLGQRRGWGQGQGPASGAGSELGVVVHLQTPPRICSEQRGRSPVKGRARRNARHLVVRPSAR